MEKQAHYSSDINRLLIDSLASCYGDESIPLKVRKINLFQQTDLPTPNVHLLTPSDFADISPIFYRDLNLELPVAIRYASIPNRFFMLNTRIDSPDEVEDKLALIKDFISRDSDIKTIIVQEATRKEDIPFKISGRYFLLDTLTSTTEEVLELYKGAQNTGVLNNSNLDLPNFISFEKKLGELCFRSGKDVGIFSRTELDDILGHLYRYKEKLYIIKNAIGQKINTREDYISLCFEFSSIRGRFSFIDID